MEVEISAGLLCRQGRFLLGKRSTRRKAYPGVWDLPGGHVEAGEAVEQALVRELREELGVTPTEWRKFAVLHEPAMEDESPCILCFHLFLVTEWSGDPYNRQPDEHETIAWFTLDDVNGLTLAYAGYPALFRAALEHRVGELDEGSQ
ncbi:MAG TPA: NUDIX hydrolase [Ktedonobacterales bacterium]|nr:NUDIX hydrolase [Ktedonobacterales bacterium]